MIPSVFKTGDAIPRRFKRFCTEMEIRRRGTRSSQDRNAPRRSGRRRQRESRQTRQKRELLGEVAEATAQCRTDERTSDTPREPGNAANHEACDGKPRDGATTGRRETFRGVTEPHDAVGRHDRSEIDGLAERVEAVSAWLTPRAVPRVLRVVLGRRPLDFAVDLVLRRHAIRDRREGPNRERLRGSNRGGGVRRNTSRHRVPNRRRVGRNRFCRVGRRAAVVAAMIEIRRVLIDVGRDRRSDGVEEAARSFQRVRVDAVPTDERTLFRIAVLVCDRSESGLAEIRSNPVCCGLNAAVVVGVRERVLRRVASTEARFEARVPEKDLQLCVGERTPCFASHLA